MAAISARPSVQSPCWLGQGTVRTLAGRRRPAYVGLLQYRESALDCAIYRAIVGGLYNGRDQCR